MECVTMESVEMSSFNVVNDYKDKTNNLNMDVFIMLRIKSRINLRINETDF